MNTKHYYLRLLRTFALAALTAAATAACSDDIDNGSEPLTPPDADGGIPVTFTANINPGSDADPAAAPGTRTVLKPDGRNGFTVEWKGTDNYNLNTCDEIGIWAAQGNMLTNNGARKTYVPATSDASSELKPKDDGNKLTLTDRGEWKFTAVYGSSGYEDGLPYFLISLQSQSAPGKTDHIAGWDFSVAAATQTVEAGDMPNIINFKFEHKLSALQLQVKNETGEALTVREIRLSVTGGQMVCKRVYDIAAGNWKADGEFKFDYLQLIANNFPELPSDGTAQNLHMLLFPEPAHGGKDMTVTVITNRGEFTRTKGAPDGGFAAGKNYLTNITIKTNPSTNSGETWTEYITSKADLIAFREKVNGGDTYDGKTVRLTADIDLTDEAWTPIGTDFSNSFNGTFDGGGYHISKLSVDNGSNYDAGLFGYVDGGSVHNLRVSGTVTTTEYYAGGIAGTLSSNSTVENCIFDGNVSGNGYVGGIAGQSQSNSRIAGCHTEGTVTATGGNTGGIAGANWNFSSIDDCYSEAEVKANYSAGGIVGENQRSTVTHCYATGKVSGRYNVGGIAGYTNDGTFTGCIALNPGLTRTSGAAVTFGRIAGINYNNTATFTSCAAFEDMTIKDNGGTGITGTTGEAGGNLTRSQCLTKDTYTTSHGFAEPTATKPGWAFDTASPWTYLPWNPAFASFSDITEANYKISVSTLGTN